MKKAIVISIFAALIATILSYEIASAGPTRVGNGDDGEDLEVGVPVREGILVETRLEAVALLKRLGVANIAGLGQLLPETEKTDILLVKSPKAPSSKNEKGEPVYARTFSEPHAATRFYPPALNLERTQLVALHIHEALHRALAPDVRENEALVSRITVAITAPDTSFDRVKDLVGRELKPSDSGGIDRRSIVEYGYRSYFLPEAQKSHAPVSSLHSLRSFFYPIEDSTTFGLGVEFTFVVLPERSYLGPIGLTTQLNLGTWRSSDVDIFGALHLNTVSDGEIKNTPVGRDTATIGFAIRRETAKVRLENQVYFTMASDATQKLNGVEYTHKYGAMFGARVAGFGKSVLSSTSVFEWGGAGEVLLGNSHEVTGGPNPEKTGRLRVVSLGPEFGYITGDFRFSLNGRFVVDSTQGVSLDQIGDLMGHGVGQGSWGAAVSWRF